MIFCLLEMGYIPMQQETSKIMYNVRLRFCRAALKLNEIVDWEPEVFHTHDWMAAPLSPLLNASPRIKNKPRKHSVLTIHNLEHQGKGTYDDFKQSGLPNDYWGSSFDYFGSMNLLKGGIQHADKITTVSPTYADEIKSEAYGCGLENILNYQSCGFNWNFERYGRKTMGSSK